MNEDLGFLITPDGIVLSAHLHTPDTKFIAEGIYSIKLKIEGVGAKTLSTFIDSRLKKSVEEANANNVGKLIKKAEPPYSWGDSEDLIVNFKMKASGISNNGELWTRKPALFNNDLTTLGSTKRIGIGSKVVVSYRPVNFFTPMIGAGVSLRLEAVQVLILKEPMPDASRYGFVNRGNREAEG